MAQRPASPHHRHQRIESGELPGADGEAGEGRADRECLREGPPDAQTADAEAGNSEARPRSQEERDRASELTLKD